MSAHALKVLLLSAALPLLAQEAAPSLPADIDRLQPTDMEGLPLDQLIRKGLEHHQAGRLADAMKDWMELARRRPEGGLGLYNLACAYGLSGRPDKAATFLEAAWNHGFKDLDTADKDADFDKVRDTPAFKATMTRLRTSERANAAENRLGRVLQVPAKAWHPVRVLTPRNHEPGRLHPLVIALHGAGGSAQTFLPIGQALAAQGFVVGLVEGQYPVRDGAVHFLAKPGLGRRPEEETLRLAEDYVLAAVETVRKQYSIHPGKIFLMGFSQGAMLTYSVGLRHGNRFRGFLPIGGTVVGELPAKAVKGGSWRVFHSPTDAAVTDADHRKAMDVLARFGIEAEAQRYPGGHVIPPAVVTDMAVWMKRLSE